jgi:heme oxygenase
MSLKELTKEKHTAAEATPFMQAVFKKKMPETVWADYSYNKMLWYGAIETKARAEGLLDTLSGIERAYPLYQDAKEMLAGNFPKFRQEAIDYQRYILDLPKGKVAGHLYTWHMGDLFGGQMIKKMLPPPHRNLEFKDVDGLKTAIRAVLTDDAGEEALAAFDWAIKIMNTYNNELDLANTD